MYLSVLPGIPMLIYLQKKKLANTDTDLVREYVYDKGLIGPSNKDLLEEVYEELRLSEEDVGLRMKIKVSLATSPLEVPY
jgi:hypothetical protein